MASPGQQRLPCGRSWGMGDYLDFVNFLDCCVRHVTSDDLLDFLSGDKMRSTSAPPRPVRVRWISDHFATEIRVNFFNATIFGYTAWRVCLGTALLLLYAALRIYWRREEARRDSEAANSNHAEPNAPQKKSWKTKPLDLTDTQRIDHLHRNVSLQAGEHADLKELTFGQLPKLRVAFAGIENESGQDFAHIKVELGGATAECGKSVQELGENDFLVPHSLNGDQHCSIHYTCGKSDAVSFLQVKVLKIDAAKQSASIDVLHVRGRRAA